MANTTITSPQVRDGEISRTDINSTVSGRAVCKKIVQGTGGIQVSSTGVDAGTGDSTISLTTAIASGPSHAGGGVPDPGSTPGTTKFLREDMTFAVPSGGGDIALSVLAPSTSETITAGYSAVVVRKYTIASGTKLTIGLGSRFRIL